MKHILESYVCTTEVKRSKFIVHLVPISEYEGLQERLKKENPKAHHVVYALRTLNEFEQIVENSSDDAEPKGCAGLPSLNVLRGEALILCAVLIVRYFGGIKLGTGGMARAYALSVKNVIQEARLLDYEKQLDYTFETSYRQIEKTLHSLKSIGISEYHREFGIAMVRWDIRSSQAKIEAFQCL
jgi:uncharacterized YigZ family protein